MQTHTDRRSPSQVKVGHRGRAEQGKVQALPRFFHAHLSLDPLRSCMKLRRHKRTVIEAIERRDPERHRIPV
jgi:hypothetical protein